MKKRRLGVKRNVRIQVIQDGRVLVDQKHKNLITNVGLAHMAGLLNGEATGALKYVALGTGNTPEDVADVEMETEVTTLGGARALGTTELATTTVADDTARVVAGFDITGAIDLTELGLFNAASSGVMGSHVTFPTVSVTDGQTLVITWDYALSEV